MHERAARNYPVSIPSVYYSVLTNEGLDKQKFLRNWSLAGAAFSAAALAALARAKPLFATAQVHPALATAASAALIASFAAAAAAFGKIRKDSIRAEAIRQKEKEAGYESMHHHPKRRAELRGQIDALQAHSGILGFHFIHMLQRAPETFTGIKHANDNFPISGRPQARPATAGATPYQAPSAPRMFVQTPSATPSAANHL